MNNKKVKQNKYIQTVQDEIDLHGLTKDEAREEVLSFVDEARMKNYNRIRIITGKGLHSENGRGVLRGFVQSLLEKQNLKYSDAKIDEGGSGAIEIDL
ncbi:MAG: Smr/MutS family protein [Candidatus Pacebacteria bacterium]|nr:Smr/MutS family protein [Candidatus Paceibacterota bacterium]